MVFKNRKSVKKGITPVIAIVLLLMMTVAAAGLAYEFIMSMSETQTKAIEEQMGSQSDKMRMDLRVLQLQNNTPDTNITFYLKNVGSIELSTIDVNNMDIKVDGEMILITTPSTNIDGACTTTDGSIPIGSTCELSINHPSMAFPNVGVTKTYELTLSNGYVLAYGCNRASAGDDFC